MQKNIAFIKITIVTVCYNAVKEIEATMLSVLNQTYPNVEYIIVDGESTDGTMEVINKYRDRLSAVISEPDHGIYDAMNKGIAKATGDWINFMNAGDTFTNSDVISSMVKQLTDDIRILRGNILRIYNKMKVKSCGVTSQQPTLMDMVQSTFHHQACLIQRSLFTEYGLYSTNFRLCSDWKFFFDCTVLHKVKSRYVDITVANFSMNGISSNGTLCYAKEQQTYLTEIYGTEMYNLLKELSIYRKSWVISRYYLLHQYLMNSLSPKTFNRFLTAKRMCYSLLGVKVN